jgi:hypothetical protein
MDITSRNRTKDAGKIVFGAGLEQADFGAVPSGTVRKSAWESQARHNFNKSWSAVSGCDVHR